MSKSKVTQKVVPFIILIIFCMTSNVLSATITMEQLVDKMNTSNPMAEHLEKYYKATVTAEAENGKLIVKQTTAKVSGDETMQIEFSLNDNILSTTIENNREESSTVYMSKLSLAWMLIDCIGQINGYEKEEFYKTIKGTGENYKNYKLDKEGLEITEINDKTEIKIDLSKKIPKVEIDDSDEEGGGVILIADASTNTYILEYGNNAKANDYVRNTVKMNTSTVVSTNNNIKNVTNDTNLPKTGLVSIVPVISFVIIIAWVYYLKYKNIDS